MNSFRGLFNKTTENGGYENSPHEVTNKETITTDSSTNKNTDKLESSENTSDFEIQSQSSVISLDEMENLMRQPPQLSFEGNLKDNWKLCHQKFTVYMAASGLNTKSDERQVAVLLHVMGDEGLEKFNTFGLNDEQKKSIAEVTKAFENFCIPKENETVERFLFFTRSQQQGETFSSFLTDLKI